MLQLKYKMAEALPNLTKKTLVNRAHQRSCKFI